MVVQLLCLFQDKRFSTNFKYNGLEGLPYWIFLEEYKIAISWMDILLTWNKTSLKRLILVYYHYVVWGHTIKLTVINTQFVIGRHKEYPITLIDRKRTLRLAYPFGEKKFFYSKLIHFRKTLIQHQDIIVSAMYHFIINS